jgi:hypothetical protein
MSSAYGPPDQAGQFLAYTKSTAAEPMLGGDDGIPVLTAIFTVYGHLTFAPATITVLALPNANNALAAGRSAINNPTSAVFISVVSFLHIEAAAAGTENPVLYCWGRQWIKRLTNITIMCPSHMPATRCRAFTKAMPDIP